MSMELYVATTSTELPTADQIGETLRSRGLSLVVEPFDWREQSGYLPMVIEGHESGVEMDLFDHTGAASILGAFSLAPEIGSRVVAFRWGSDSAECGCALAAAAAIALLTGGKILEPDAGEIMGVDRALADAREFVNGIT